MKREEIEKQIGFGEDGFSTHANKHAQLTYTLQIRFLIGNTSGLLLQKASRIKVELIIGIIYRIICLLLVLRVFFYIVIMLYNVYKMMGQEKH